MLDLDAIKLSPSPSRYADRRGADADLVVVHYTAGKGNATRVAQLFAHPGRQASAHYVVGRHGDLVQCVSLDDAAWHAGDKGRSRFPVQPMASVPLSRVGPMPRAVNLRSVGIELCNLGWALPDDFDGPVLRGRHRNPASTSEHWEDYPKPQLDALDDLLAALVGRVPSLRWVCGHEDVTHQDTLGRPGAKLDPGPAFPWADLQLGGLQRVAYDFGAKAWRFAVTGARHA